MTLPSFVAYKDFDSANKFMEALSPRSSLWYPLPERWIFRGQRDATWKLIPSAFRPESWIAYESIVAGLGNIGYKNNVRLQLELNAVWWFAQAADRQGLPVPGFDHKWMRGDDLERKFNDINDVFTGHAFFPLPEWRPLFGMAQHYGIPTRFLDWSESSYIAAYFAASSATELVKGNLNKRDGYLAVWALAEHLLESLVSSSGERIRAIRVPWNPNPNLRAQKGLFTLHETRLQPDGQAAIVPLEEALQKLVEQNSRSSNSKPVLYCLRLDVNKAPLLLRLLSQEGISAVSLFPGYDGVVRGARELKFYGVVNYRDFDPTES